LFAAFGRHGEKAIIEPRNQGLPCSFGCDAKAAKFSFAPSAFRGHRGEIFNAQVIC
jgi:hypothetical protein